jgi:hypothetical protein
MKEGKKSKVHFLDCFSIGMGTRHKAKKDKMYHKKDRRRKHQ